jgi:isopropylmalate/homocitrate/citramalate synthase
VDVETLNSLVSSAIWRAEQLEDSGLETASSAWGEVSKWEEELANAIAAKEPEGRIARRGAVRAALKAGDHLRAQGLVQRYATGNGVPSTLRRELQGMLKENAKQLAEQFPSAAKHHKPNEVQSLARQLLEHGPFSLAAA